MFFYIPHSVCTQRYSTLKTQMSFYYFYLVILQFLQYMYFLNEIQLKNCFQKYILCTTIQQLHIAFSLSFVKLQKDHLQSQSNNNQLESMESTFHDIFSQLLQCFDEIIHYACHSKHHSFGKRNQDASVRSGSSTTRCLHFSGRTSTIFVIFITQKIGCH